MDRAKAFCEMYGMKLPILLAPMAGSCPVSLSIAVANAGDFTAYRNSFYNLRYGLAAEALDTLTTG